MLIIFLSIFSLRNIFPDIFIIIMQKTQKLKNIFLNL